MNKRKEAIQIIKIREYQPSDYTAVKKNLLEAGIFDSVWDSKESLNIEIKRNSDFILVAEIDGKVVGNVYLGNWWGHGSWIFHLVVRKEYRGKEIATRLMDEAEKRLKQKGVKEVALFVEVDNLKAKKFYADRGYKDFPGEYKSVVKTL